MEEKDSNLVQSYLQSDVELKSLWEQHLKFENQLNKIQRKPYLTSDEKIEKKRLQMAKLKGKTRIEQILDGYRHPSS